MPLLSLFPVAQGRFLLQLSWADGGVGGADGDLGRADGGQMEVWAGQECWPGPGTPDWGLWSLTVWKFFFSLPFQAIVFHLCPPLPISPGLSWPVLNHQLALL